MPPLESMGDHAPTCQEMDQSHGWRVPGCSRCEVRPWGEDEKEPFLPWIDPYTGLRALQPRAMLLFSLCGVKSRLAVRFGHHRGHPLPPFSSMRCVSQDGWWLQACNDWLVACLVFPHPTVPDGLRPVPDVPNQRLPNGRRD